MLETTSTYYKVAFITPPKINTDILWGLSIFFVGLAVVYFISVFFFRNRISATAARTKQRKKELSPMISEFLFYEKDADKEEKSNYISLKIEIRELLKDNFNRKVLVEVLLDLRKDVSGDTQERLFSLYQDLGLEKDAFQKLKSWRWEVISKGILELTQMEVETAYSFITKFINHKTATIRKQAEIATVTLKPEGINYFLDTTRYKISEWQQLKLLDVIRNQEDFNPPRFRMWLTSKNIHVVLFTLRLIKYYNQNDANASLIELVKHKNHQIKEEAIGCIKEFYVVEAIPTLKSIFKKCNTDSKIAVLGAIAELGSVDDIDFLRNTARKESNFSVSSKALAAMNTISPESVMPSEGIEYQKEYVADAEENIITDGIENNEVSTPQMKEEEVVESPPEIEEVLEDSITEEIPASVDYENKIANIAVEEVELEEFVLSTETSAEDKTSIEEENPETEHVQVESFEITEIIVTDPIFVSSVPLEKPKPQAEEFIEQPLRFDFLPIVIANNTATNQPISKYKPMAYSENNSPDINNIKVVYVEVSSSLQKDARMEKPFFDISKIDFLPIVVEEEKLENKMSELIDAKVTDDTLVISNDEDLHELIDEINELNFLPIVLDNEVVIEEDLSRETSEQMVFEEPNSLDGFTLSDFEVQFENTENLVPQENNELPVSAPHTVQPEPVVAESNEEDVMSWLMADNELREIELEYEIVSPKETSKPFLDLIPEPVYYDEHESYMMGLLDDLEEMGDHREVPLLKELLAEETAGFIKDRINSLIEQFSYFGNMISKIGNKLPEERSLEMPVFSVFADLFKNIGTESKLVLLDEIVAVGDEKEIDFLDGLLEDPDLKIRKKAQGALKLLVEKVSRKSEFEKDLLPKPVDELPIDLSILEPFPESKSKIKNSKISKAVTGVQDSEILEFDFELVDTEVLDKKSDKKILNIQVESIEVSSSEGSFLSNIIEFPKKLIGKLNG
ncbi:HEAT repeat domain-containing protein [Zobellia amurskyensis]|uniref:HEAT repeat domain-containing protein n=1 Tax=Zobellia amurskyensis TaxID=248905 RepID=A0A7X2ZUT6_9FLAO|nr:HEAT repeat domain-containing protein [Zobellia amurskyensis]MUH36805.1 HEAT repeat domain-containing protein [Zobellia amurskyensis]